MPSAKRDRRAPMRVSRVFIVMLMLAALIPASVLAQAPRPPIVSPDVHSNGNVTFRLFAPNAVKVLLNSGEMQSVLKVGSFPMTNDDNGVWSVTVGPLSPGLYDYTFNLDGVAITDPASKQVFGNRQGSRGYAEVPGPPGHPRHDEWRDVPHGNVTIHWYNSSVSGTRRRVHVYTPPGYAADPAKKFPVLYLLHGSGDNDTHWMHIGQANVIADNLFADKAAVPMLIVMPDGHVRERPPGQIDDETRLAIRKAFELDLLEHVVPLVESNYRVRMDAAGRAIAGLSMGSAQALGVGLAHTDRFAWIGAFSGAIGLKDPVLAALKADPGVANDRLKLLWLVIGREDVGLKDKQQLADALNAMGVKHHYQETDGAHRWSVWRLYLSEFLPRLFQEP